MNEEHPSLTATEPKWMRCYLLCRYVISMTSHQNRQEHTSGKGPHAMATMAHAVGQHGLLTFADAWFPRLVLLPTVKGDLADVRQPSSLK